MVKSIPIFPPSFSQGANGSSLSSGRLLDHRTSLLGKPINYRANRRDVKYRKLQERPLLLYYCILFMHLKRPKVIMIFLKPILRDKLSLLKI